MKGSLKHKILGEISKDGPNDLFGTNDYKVMYTKLLKILQ